ncbi:hypothetical protein T4D_848 [Trichinella pseudospiralis]|uniref:Uncharacterized protein n=1 Tax=Trichinella pseudospiralis TaxID=6337 RepID=A0A0V1FNT3_TRIPS|nr:hypothetical protein T4D_848 [Trichinella pseudospiralis]
MIGIPYSDTFATFYSVFITFEIRTLKLERNVERCRNVVYWSLVNANSIEKDGKQSFLEI